jgi:hypothetical protein
MTKLSFTCIAALLLTTGYATADDEDDAEFTKLFEPTGEECSKIAGQTFTFTGKMAVDPDKLSISACGNIADGLRYVCQDNTSAENKAKLVKALAKVKGVVCEYAQPKQKTAIVKLAGTTMTVWTNIEMSDPSERARCVIAKTLGVKYKGDLDKNCFERKH